MDDYVTALCREMEVCAPAYQGRDIVSIYIGGGTPSLLSADQMERLTETLERSFSLKLRTHPAKRFLPKPRLFQGRGNRSNAWGSAAQSSGTGAFPSRKKDLSGLEFSIECNPGTVDADKLAIYRKCGINRLSIGLQSTDNEDLKVLGRIHTYEDFERTFEIAREKGFDNINVDLMQAIPGQTLMGWQRVLAILGVWRPEHISAYSLIVEPGTPFYQMQQEGKLFLPDEDTEREIYYYTRDFLEKAGYHRYEISNYAREGYECRHNIGYWRRTDYLGLGLHASSMIQNTRWKNTDDLDLYIRSMLENHPARDLDETKLSHDETKLQHDETKLRHSDSEHLTLQTIREDYETLSYREQMEEFVILGLRMTEGINRKEFLDIFHQDIEIPYGAILHRMQELGLLHFSGDQISLTDRGFDVSNTVFAEFLSEH